MSENKQQATWGGRFEDKPSDLMLQIGESVSFDCRLAMYDIECSRAHASMLEKVGILNNLELKSILSGLEKIEEAIESQDFKWRSDLEDVHMNIEQALTDISPEALKLHTARSRNDQVATDMRLWFKDACVTIIGNIELLVQNCIEFSEANAQVIIPGYTHLQRAQPVPISHHLLAYVEMLVRDMNRFSNVWDSANVCPLGSGAIAGTTLPIDRLFVAEKLGFVDDEGEPIITQNSMDAVSDRDLFIDFANACATAGVHLSRLSEDFILWSSSEFGFVRLPDAFTTGSSLMPQKKNPDGFELIRGKSARLIGNTQILFTMMKGLPLTYNRDMQEDKLPVFDSYDQINLMLKVTAATLKGVKVNESRCVDSVSDPLLLATDVVDYLVLKGVAFRDAHHIVGALVKLSETLELPLDALPFDQVKAIDERIDEDWVSVFSLERALKSRKQIGMPSFEQIASQISVLKERFKEC
ncbi:MAG: argininosuccinate lyase [Opitutae bacterium]|nr:argininosuccinate lyase [Opitutae bacterium]